jgi:hypothetical protein
MFYLKKRFLFQTTECYLYNFEYELLAILNIDKSIFFKYFYNNKNVFGDYMIHINEMYQTKNYI